MKILDFILGLLMTALFAMVALMLVAATMVLTGHGTEHPSRLLIGAIACASSAAAAPVVTRLLRGLR